MNKEKIIKEQNFRMKLYILKEYQKSLDKLDEVTKTLARAKDKSITTNEDSYYHSDDYIGRQTALLNYWDGVCYCYKWTIEWLDAMLDGDKKNGNRY